MPKEATTPKKVAVFNDTSLARKQHFGCNLVMTNLTVGLLSHKIEPVFQWPVGADWREHRHLLPSRGTIDGIVVNGEGSIHHDATRPRATYLAELATLAHETYGVPAFLLNATLHKNSSELYKTIAEYDHIAVRDSMSRDECLMHGLDPMICPDLTLSRPFLGTEMGRNGVGVTDSCFVDVSKRLKSFAAGNKADYVAMENRRLPKMLRGIEGREAFFSDKRFVGTERDLYRTHSADFFLSWLASKSFVVTGRYHTVTMCLLTGTPFLAIESNTPKITSLLEAVFGNADRVFPRDANIGEIVQSGKTSYTQSEISSLATFLSNAQNRSESLFGLIRSRLDAT